MKKSAPAARWQLLWSNARGEMRDDARYEVLGRSGTVVRSPKAGEMMLAPPGTQFHFLPGRTPTVRSVPKGVVSTLEGRLAVAAVLPTGYARTLLPAYVRNDGAPTLPLFGYTACAVVGDETWVAAMPTEETIRWDNSQYDTVDLPKLVRRQQKRFPNNRLLTHLSRCALEYHCYTSQNTFYQRWEAAIPVSPACNAVCIGCISEQEPDRPPSPQERLTFVPTLDEIVELTVNHLQQDPTAIMSYGQGCEGEPTLQADLIARSILKTREQVQQGTIHLNTNAGNPHKLQTILDAGLNSIRVSLNSVHAPWYEAYYRPRNYRFHHVEESVKRSRDKGIFISLNLLYFPGINDLPEETARLIDFITRYRIDKVQMRNLNIDPDDYLACLPGVSGTPSGIPAFVAQLREACPWLDIGNFSPPV